MGLFRLLLASTIMLGHFVRFYPKHLPYLMLGWASVPAFYIASGFLITLVLRERYHERFWLFYTNRALRIFPLYWVTLLLFLAVNWLVAGGYLPGPHEHTGTNAIYWWRQHDSELGPLAMIMMIFSNVAIFGQDWMLFIGKWPHIFTRDSFYHSSCTLDLPGRSKSNSFFMRLPPSSSCGMSNGQLPFRSFSLLARLIAVTALGFSAYSNAYDFPPFEMAFFMGGSLAYRAYAYLRSQKSEWIATYSYAATLLIALLSILYLFIPVARPIYLVTACACLPGIVLLGRRNPFDNFLGELSYPIYLLHPIFTIFVIPGTGLSPEIIAVAGTVSLSAFLVLAIDRPLEVFRHRRAKAAPELAMIGRAAYLKRSDVRFE